MPMNPKSPRNALLNVPLGVPGMGGFGGFQKPQQPMPFGAPQMGQNAMMLPMGGGGGGGNGPMRRVSRY